MTEFRMPALGADMEAGTLVAWRKKPGDQLVRGDIIAEVETDKGIIEIEVYAPGVLERYLVEPGQKVPVGTPLALLQQTETQSTSLPEEPVHDASVTQARPLEPTSVAAPSTGVPRSSEAPRASPSARRRARELGIDPASLRGSGPSGALTLRDVELAATGAASSTTDAAREQATASPAAPDRQRALRRAVAAAMTRAKREIPHYYLSTTVDLGAMSSWLDAANAERSVRERVLAGALLLKAVALAAQRLPEFNARWDGEQAKPLADVHLGVAIALRGGGLIAPAIHNADRLTLPALMAALLDLVARARTGALRSSELSDGTLTVTSLGERGVEAVFPVIYPPQTAIVGFGRIVERPWVVGGALAVRKVVTATLAADHRVTDGHLGARFLALVDSLLQEPEKL